MITKDLKKIFVDGVYSKPPMRVYPTSKKVYNHLDENGLLIWLT